MEKNKTIFLIIAMSLMMFAVVKFSSADVGLLSVTLLNQNPNPASAGDTVILNFQVENTGANPVTNINFNLEEAYPFTVVDSDKIKTITSLGAYQTGDNYADIQFTVKIDKGAHTGTYPLKIKYGDNNGLGLTIIKTYNIVVTGQNYAQIIYVDKAQLQPGMETDLNFTINNVGSAPLQNLVFSWNEPNGVVLPIYSDDTRYIKYLDVGQSVELNYKVVADVNAKPGLYKLNLNLQYQSANNATNSVITSNAGVLVGGQTDFDVAFSESTQGQTSLSVANTGNNPALSVSVIIPQQQNYRVTGSNSAIIGNLDKGDYTLVSFQISANSIRNSTGAQRNFRQNETLNDNFSNSNDLQVIIQYTDTTGQRVSVEKSVPIQFRGTTKTSTAITTASKGFIGGTLFWVIIVVIVLVGGYFVYRGIAGKSGRKIKK